MDIKQFFEGVEIFITGGSGLVGKALIEVLLRTCNVNRIFVLLRSKKDLDASERLKKMRNDKIFRVLRSKKPQELQKLTAVAGDAVLSNLGISVQAAKMMENVSIVFHCAATVRFDEPLKVAVRLNVGGTLETLKFSETLKDLKAFLHVSTFFSNPYLKTVEAKLYDPPMDWRTCLKLINDSENSDVLDALTRKIITGFPNTYTFTKNLAESLVNEWRHRMPVAIYRPSVVIPSIRDPEPGFPTTVVGAMGHFVAVGAGICKVVYLAEDCYLDLTPLDMGVIVMLYYAHKAAADFVESKDDGRKTPVFLFSSSKVLPFPLQEMVAFCERTEILTHRPFNKQFLIPGSVRTSNRLYYLYLVFLKQLLPALLLDSILKILGCRGVFMPITRRTFMSQEVMKPFLFNSYKSTGITHMEDIQKDFAGTDLECFELSKLKNWDFLYDYFEKIFYQIRKILLKENPDTIPRARKVLAIKKTFYGLMRIILVFCICRWLYRNILNTMFSSD